MLTVWGILTVLIDGVITVFMILFGVNFSLYFLLLIKEYKAVWKNEELRRISESLQRLR